MRQLSTCKYFLPLLTAIGLFGQTSQPQPLLNQYVAGIAATTILDNRSFVLGRLTYVSIACSGASTWSVSLQYGTTYGGSYTSYGSAATVTDSSNPPVAWGFLAAYPNYIKILVNSGSPTCNFSGFTTFYPSLSSNAITSIVAGTGISVSGSSTITVSNTGVLSFNSRTGVVTPTTGDYTAAQVTNAFDLTANNAIGAHYETFTDISTPATPSAGLTRVYSKGGKSCSLDSAASENCTGTGGGGSVFTGSTATNPSFSATPTFSLADVSVKSPVRVEFGTLTANVTAVTFSNKTAGAKFSIVWTQDGTGGRTVTYGASATGTCQVTATAGVSTTQFFEVAADGSTVNGTYCVDTTGDVVLAGSTSGTVTLRAPAVAGARIVTFPAGTTDFTATGGTSNVLKQATVGAAITVGQLAASDLSNGTSGSGAVCLASGSACSGGGSGSYSAGCPPSASTTMTGSDITLCTIASVPALTAGSCYTFTGLAEAAQNYQVFVYADGTLIDTPIANNNTWGGYYIGWTSLYCNGAAVQNAQTMEPLFSTFQNTGLSYAIATTVVAGTNAGGYPITPTAVDWSTSHTITVKMNAASGAGRLFGFKIN